MSKLGLNAHERPPEGLSSHFKHFRALSRNALQEEPSLMDVSNEWIVRNRHLFSLVRHITVDELHASFSALGNPSSKGSRSGPLEVLELKSLPGLHLIQGLLPPDLQWQLVSRLLHRDLANDNHKTNLNLHYKLPYHLTAAGGNTKMLTKAVDTPENVCRWSFFNCKPTSKEVLQPLDAGTHKAMSISKFLSKKLRWITLGGQYDWTRKQYPEDNPPPFPEDIASFIKHCFPDMTPEAAIVNVYSPGDTLSLHRDVSEESDKGLVSISLGCDAIFIAGIDSDGEDGTNSVALRLHSGDALYMSGTSRYLWHGVPQILPGTCPTWLSAWPTDSDCSDNRLSQFQDWQGWMATKRVNLNIRQMRD